MKPENETCVAQLRVIFDLRRDQYSSKDNSEQARVLNALDCLATLNPDWEVEVSTKRVIAMNSRITPKLAYQVLRDGGYEEKEFRIEVEYTRKWGVL